MVVPMIVMAVAVIVVIMSMSVPMIIPATVVMVVVWVAVILVLAVVIAIVVPILGALLAAPVMPFPSFVPAPVGVLTTHWVRPAIAESRIIMPIDVSMKSNRSLEPRPRADKYAACEPLRSVVAKRSAPVRRVIEISIRTHRRRADVYGNVYLGIGL